MGRHKELCRYCFNQRELMNADLVIYSCPVCGPRASTYPKMDPLELAKEVMKKVLKEKV